MSESTVTQNTAPGATNPDDVARVIVLIYGLLEESRPFWCYVAVKPSKYQAFLDEQKAGTLNLFEFGKYGEIIISGEGSNPPDEVTLKVAEVYQTDPRKFFEPVDPDKEVAERVKEFDEKNKK